MGYKHLIDHLKLLLSDEKKNNSENYNAYENTIMQLSAVFIRNMFTRDSFECSDIAVWYEVRCINRQFFIEFDDRSWDIIIKFIMGYHTSLNQLINTNTGLKEEINHLKRANTELADENTNLKTVSADLKHKARERKEALRELKKAMETVQSMKNIILRDTRFPNNKPYIIDIGTTLKQVVDNLGKLLLCYKPNDVEVENYRNNIQMLREVILDNLWSKKDIESKVAIWPSSEEREEANIELQNTVNSRGCMKHVFSKGLRFSNNRKFIIATKTINQAVDNLGKLLLCKEPDKTDGEKWLENGQMLKEEIIGNLWTRIDFESKVAIWATKGPAYDEYVIKEHQITDLEALFDNFNNKLKQKERIIG
ncbi:hypothetical protein BDB01DRAFT_850611 [Pilobolus umbonatus]|nr:hypothetical protein BDB01DRAFT_850611 [Pilobolus umbonatus]